MATFINILWALLLVVIVPLTVVQLLTEGSRERARRLRRTGYSQQRIATEMGISRHKVRKLLA